MVGSVYVKFRDENCAARALQACPSGPALPLLWILLQGPYFYSDSAPARRLLFGVVWLGLVELLTGLFPHAVWT